ncbi:MAG: chromate efflux transporter [Cyclobacteriaceae bacterium]
MSERPNLIFLLKSFFKIGLTSFGGHAALVSVLQEELVRKKKVISEDIILDGLSIASVLPGPLAVNVVAYIGFKLRGWIGTVICMFFVLLPSTVIMIGIAKLYAKYSNLDIVNLFLSGVIPVIIALILSLSYNMFVKNISMSWQYILFFFILILAFFLNSYIWIVIYIVFGGIVGYFLNGESSNKNDSKCELGNRGAHLYYGVILSVLVFVGLYFFLKGIYHQLLFEFSKVSLTLFGGGYVMIPMLHEIVVENYQWLSSIEFTNAIAFGQMTPGPILVSATYVGYVTGGVWGAFLATLGIFAPSAIIMVLVGGVFESIKNHPIITGVIKGIRPVVIALITYSGWILFRSLDHELFSIFVILSSFVIITTTKFNYFYLVLISGGAAILFF